MKSDSQEIKNACKLAKRCYEKLEKGDFEDGVALKKVSDYRWWPKIMSSGSKGGFLSMIYWCQNQSDSTAAKISFSADCQKFYKDWLQQHPDTPEEEKPQFSKQCVKGWELEYGVSLRKPNKRYSISKRGCIIQVQDYLKNIWNLRDYFIKTFGVDPPIITGDQILLHWNESSGQATFSFKNKKVFINENHHLSRERIAVFTQIATARRLNLCLEFVLKGTGKKPLELTTTPNVHYQWGPKGMYHLEQLLETTKHLLNCFNIFSYSNCHLRVRWLRSTSDAEIRKALWDRGYILLIIGGGITGFVKVNGTHLHKQLKNEYSKKESALMLEKLKKDPQKFLSPDRSEMMSLLVESEKSIALDTNAAFK